MNRLIVVAAALVDGTGRVLVQRRPPGGSHGGLWEFPGGKVEFGEDLTAALVRELREELGIGADAASFVPLSFAGGIAGERDLILLLYRLREWKGEPEPLHASALAWKVPAALRELPMPPADLALVGALDAAA